VLRSSKVRPPSRSWKTPSSRDRTTLAHVSIDTIQRTVILLAIVVSWTALTLAQQKTKDSGQPNANVGGQGSSSSGAISNALNRSAVVQFLNDTIQWYQQLLVESKTAMEPTDVLYINNAQPTANQIVHQSFEFARAVSQLVGSALNEGTQFSVSTDSRYRNLAQTVAKLDGEIKQDQTQLQSLEQKLANTPHSRRRALESAIAETNSEVSFMQERRDLLRNMMEFMDQSLVSGSFMSQIDAFERSVPEASGSNQESNEGEQRNGAAPLAVPPASRELQPTNVWGTVGALIVLTKKLEKLKQHQRQTEGLRASAKRLQEPMVASFTEMAAQSEEIVNEPESKDPAVLSQQMATLDALRSRYKLLGTALLPLSKELILLDIYQTNLTNWYGAVKSEYTLALRALLIRLLGLAALLAIILGIFEAWRRTIVRYVTDVRRRNQFLLLRRIALGVVLGLIILFGLVSELGSLATFAGLMTAGVAVALQNVILAVVGYFLLIGKFGLQVGDRVQVSGVFGEVVEIGLIRMQIMEFSNPETDAQPTGRIVAISNAVVFQSNAGLFRQIPGSSLDWHAIALTLTPDSDYRTVEQRMVAAVGAAFEGYEQEFERLRRRMEISLSSVSIRTLAPNVKLRLTSAGLEVLVRFPVESGRAREIDDRITREVVRAIETEPRLKVVETEAPSVQVNASRAASSSPSRS
jgi:small-conductance mechanosensitive channel